MIEDPKTKWDRPALTMYGGEYASVRDEGYRYIRYPDGIEELYDHRDDPHELNNLASDPHLAAVKRRRTRWIPTAWAKSLSGRLR